MENSLTGESASTRGPIRHRSGSLGPTAFVVAVAVFVVAVVQVGTDVVVDAADGDIELEVFESEPIVITVDGDLQSGQLGSSISDQCLPTDTAIAAGAGQQYVCFGTQPPSDLTIDVTGPQWGDPEWNAALGWIVTEATEMLPVLYDIPADERVAAYGRPEITAYVKDRLIGIIDKEVFQVPLTDQEQGAYDYVVDKLIADDAKLAQAAYDQYVSFRDEPCSYSVPRAPAYIEDPVKLPSDVRESCEYVQTALATAFDVVPPYPTVEQFQTWGAYQSGLDMQLTTNEEQELADRTGEAVQASALGIGLAGAFTASGIAAMLVGSGAGVSSIAVGLIGSQLAINGGAYSLAGALSPAIGATAVASVIGVVIFAVIVLGIVIWRTIEREQVGQTLAARLHEARSALDPLGMAGLQAEWSGQPLAEYGDDLPIHYDGDVNLRLLDLVVEGYNVHPGGGLVEEPDTLWAPNGTDVGDHRFRLLDGPNAGQIVDSLHIAQDAADEPDLDVRFDQGWMLVTEEDGAAPGIDSVEAELAFSYRDPSGQLLRVMRAPPQPEHPDGGFILIPFDAAGVSPGEFADELVIDDGTGTRRVELVTPGTLTPGDVYPAAIGTLRAGSIVGLRPNPVDDSGAFDIDAFTTGYDFDWTVERFDTATSTWVVVHTSTDHATGFVAPAAGTYRAAVVMQEDVPAPQPAVSGAVEFEVTAPQIFVDDLTLVDDGFEDVYLDLQLGEMALSDTIELTIQWPGEIDDDTPGLVTNTTVSCSGFAGAHPCNTNPATDWSTVPALTFEPGPLADLGQGATVTLENSYGVVTTRQVAFASGERPEFVAASAVDPSVEFSAAESHVQRVVGDTGSIAIAEVVPDAGSPIGLGLYDPVLDSHGSSFLVIGSDSLRVSLVESGGDWVVTVSGTADPDDVGTHRIPIVVQQTDAGGPARATHVLDLDIVPAANDRYRAALVNKIPSPGVLIDDVPDLPLIVMGGRADEAAYTGDVCVSFYRAAFPPTAEQCADVSTFFGDDGSPRRFPFERLLPTGIAGNSIHRATVRAANGDLADTRALQVSFRVPSGPPPAPTMAWSPNSSEMTIGVTAGERPIVEVVCTIDEEPAPDCVGPAGGVADLGEVFDDPFNGTYEIRAVAIDDIGNYHAASVTVEITDGKIPPPDPSVPAAFEPMVPQRLVETRDVPGFVTVDRRFEGDGPLVAGEVLEVQIAGRGDVPVDASAVVINATVTNTAGFGFVTFFPCGPEVPQASNVNYGPGVTVANTAVVKLSSSGSLCVFSLEGTDLIIDANAYLPEPSSATPMVPQRLVETRDVPGFVTVDRRFEGDGPLVAGEVLEVQIAGRGDVPVDASAVVINATVTNTAGFGFVTFFPCGPEVPQASNVNYGPGVTVANTAVVKLSSSGSLCVFSLEGTDLIIDANAYTR